MTGPATPVFDRFARAWPKPDAPAAQYLPIESAFGTTWSWDAHFAAYSRPDVPYRLDSHSPGADDVQMVLAAFDVDAPAKAATPEWYGQELPKVQAVAAAHPGVWVYPTRGGYRLVWRLAAPQPTRGWWRYVKAWLGYLETSFGIAADPKCTDWTRLYRLPLVMRDGRQTTGAAVQYGAGTWAPPVVVAAEPPRAAVTAAPRAPRPAAYAAVVALHFANPPSDDRNAHSMAFAAAGAHLGASPERVEADLTALLEASHADQRHIRAVPAIVERTFERIAEGEPVAWRPSAWRGTQLELDLGVAWNLEPTHAPQPAAALAQSGDAGWSLTEGSLMGAPQSVERALKAYRAALRTPDARPELANSSAVLKWLTGVKGWDAARVGRELGLEAGQFAATLARPEVQTVGRLTRIDQALSAHDMRWNEMALRIECDGEPWTDNHTAGLRLLLEQTGACDPEKPIPNGDIEQRARAVAAPYHPVVEYLDSLPVWDGTERLSGLWVNYFGAADEPLNRKLGLCFGIAAVRRIVEPGCKFDMLMILLGDQGEAKSTALSVLAGGSPAFTDAAPQFSHRSENAMTLTGCWVWEIAEMQGMDRAELNSVKAFVTRQSDDVLLPYGRSKVRLLRRSVMIGTTNDDTCLTDHTGSRRHPVIKTGTINPAALQTDRDQLWAEALHRCRAGEKHWLSKEDEREVGVRNISHTRRDEALIQQIEEWLAKPAADRFTAFGRAKEASKDTFTIRDVLTYALNTTVIDRAAEIKAGVALKQSSAVFVGRVGPSKIRTWAFPKPPAEAK